MSAKKYVRYVLGAAMALPFLGALYWLMAGMTTLKVIVIDDSGNPIDQAAVYTGWSKPMGPGEGWGQTQVGRTEGHTDSTGVTNLRIGGVGPVIAECQGYYRGGISDDDMHDLMKHRVWSLSPPQVTVMLLKKIHPVPMYVRTVGAERIGRIPQLGMPCGFDLMRYDWTPPHGSGEFADFNVTARLAYRAERDYDYTCEITFSGEGAGLQLVSRPYRDRMNELRLPREAFLDGYMKSWMDRDFFGSGPFVYVTAATAGDSGGVRNYEDDNFIFRIKRRGLIEEGKSSWMYGKIHGRIQVQVLPRFPKPGQEIYLGLEFHYYLNPDGTRSLEWNGENLFPNVPDQEHFNREP